MKLKAHQRIIREKKAKEKPPLGLFPDKPAEINLQTAKIKRINYQTAEKIIKEYEWLGTMPTYCTHYFGIYFNGICGGVVVFGISLPKNVLGSICGKEYLKNVRVLSRGACVHWTPTGSATKLIGNSLKLLKKEGYKIILAYSDVRAGEIGTIYQACNFLYTGVSKGGKEVLIDNKWRTRMPRCVIENRVKIKDLPSRERSLKHRYVYLMGTRKDVKELKNKLNYKILPYPKRSNAVEVSREIHINSIGEGAGQYRDTAQ
tara:strand:+ start:39 stop:818 length:780 start_codon:yes stop_codon:yes gene_type:complete